MEECVNRGGVDGAIHHGGGGAAAQQFVHKKTGDIARVSGVGKLPLGRVRVSLQPRQQAGRRRGDHVGLRVVEMGVDEARHDQFSAIVLQRRARRQASLEFGKIADGLHMIVVDEQQAVFVPLVRLRMECRVGGEMQNAGTVGVQAATG